MSIQIRPMLMTTIAALTLAGCATTNGGNNALGKGLLGAAGGAVAGAIIGNNAGDGDAQSGALIGAIIGGAGGAYVGCREDGGCGAGPKFNAQNHTVLAGGPPKHKPATHPAPTGQRGYYVDHKQFFDNKTGRYFFYDPHTRREYWESGEPKHA